jgi:hypothetical protein
LTSEEEIRHKINHFLDTVELGMFFSSKVQRNFELSPDPQAIPWLSTKPDPFHTQKKRMTAFQDFFP